MLQGLNHGSLNIPTMGIPFLMGIFNPESGLILPILQGPRINPNLTTACDELPKHLNTIGFWPCFWGFRSHGETSKSSSRHGWPFYWLVVYQNPSEKYDFVSWDDFSFPSEWKVIIHSCSSHHQADIVNHPIFPTIPRILWKVIKVMFQTTNQFSIETYRMVPPSYKLVYKPH